MLPKGVKHPTAGKKTAGKGPSTEVRRTGIKKKKRTESFALYIYKVLKQVHSDVGISKKSMSIMNSFINDIFDRLATEAIRLIRYNKKKTLTSREIQTALRLLLPGELSKHAVSEGTKAVTKYTSSAPMGLPGQGSSANLPTTLSLEQCSCPAGMKHTDRCVLGLSEFTPLIIRNRRSRMMRRHSEAAGATILGNLENSDALRGQAYEIVEGVVSGLSKFVSTAIPTPPVDAIPSLLRPPISTSALPTLNDATKLVLVTTLRPLEGSKCDILTAFMEESRKPVVPAYHFREVLETLCRRSTYVEDKRWIFRDWLDYSIEVLLLLCGKSQEWLQQLRPRCQQSLALSARLEAELRDPHWELLYLLSLRETDIDLYQHLLSTWFETSVENAVEEEEPGNVQSERSDDTFTWMVETLVEHVAELPVVAVESVIKKSGFISHLDPTSGGGYLGLQRRERLVIFPSHWDSLSLCVEQVDRSPYISPADGIETDTLESAVKQVVSSSDLERVSLRELRRKLEQKLGLPELALDKNKNTIKEMVGKAITEAEQKAEEKVKPEVVAEPWSRSNIKVPVGKNKVMASCQFQIIVQKSKEWPEK
ncbi:hypothetical protein FOL47_003365 [Perkinsus chesapeaki]|uniref:Histone H2B n=1 Tax=Perkinsus chesapeaki TaxID=330153 RepID=A0A7J6M8M2_PERCH|nr:hypothetical protein FOL47_003365 [Perkinsus chesapeaki]